MYQAHIFVHGLVQGVGFRKFVKYHAKKRLVTGWVQNLSDGRVEAILQSEDKQAIEAIINAAYKGPYLSDVTGIETHWDAPEGHFLEFEIRKG